MSAVLFTDKILRKTAKMHCNQYIPSKFDIDIQEYVHKHIQVVRIVQCDKKIVE